MGFKIFVSYKYADDSVENLDNNKDTTVRNYVDKLEEILSCDNHIYKGEQDGEDLSNLAEETLWERLRDRIYDSSITLILVSPNMKELGKRERDQWIPWEISYSLKETARVNQSKQPITSKTNAMIAIALPSASESYDYVISEKDCCKSGCLLYKTNKLFDIHRENMFNYKSENPSICQTGSMIWTGNMPHYIPLVKWQDFISNTSVYLENAKEIRDNIEEYIIKKELGEN